MAKRRLTEQQKRRIAANKQQAESATSLDAFKASQLGVVIAHHGQQLLVESENRQQHRCFARQNIGSLVTGDEVTWCPHQDPEQSGVVIARGERRSVLVRPDPYRQQREIAANIDEIIVVIAVEPEPIPVYIDQYLMVAAWLDIPASIVLNKSDLLIDNAMPELLSLYEKIGYRIDVLSAKVPEGLQDWQAHLSGKNVILVGQSGVGKSSLLNALVPNANAAEGSLSVSNQKGRHTTTTARLYHLPFGGNLIDAPGTREFGVWHIPELERVKGFIEFRPFLGKCRFRDCSHTVEPGCALLAAVEAGDISAQRWQSYCRLVKDSNPIA